MRQQFLMMAIAISSFVGCASEAPAPEAETTMPDAAPAMPTPEAVPGESRNRPMFLSLEPESNAWGGGRGTAETDGAGVSAWATIGHSGPHD